MIGGISGWQDEELPFASGREPGALQAWSSRRRLISSVRSGGGCRRLAKRGNCGTRPLTGKAQPNLA